jgi:hypothetical protein
VGAMEDSLDGLSVGDSLGGFAQRAASNVARSVDEVVATQRRRTLR